jgi:EAL domain-containing protein (putative c-di-GMP-specific phosphodiesterase class I)
MSSTRAPSDARRCSAVAAGSGSPAAKKAGTERAGSNEDTPGEWARIAARGEGALDPLVLMQRVADQALSLIEAADGVLVGLLMNEQSLRYVCGSGYLEGFVGEWLALDGSLSGEAIRTGETLKTDDSEADERVNREATRAFNVRSSVVVPLGRPGAPTGAMNVSSERVGAFGEHDVDLLRGLADFISAVVGAASDLLDSSGSDLALARRFVANVLNPHGAQDVEIRSEIGEVLSDEAFSIVFQPIFDLGSGALFGVEALARFSPGAGCAPMPPDMWIDRAHRVGLGVDLELALFKAAIGAAGGLLGGTMLTLNLGPDALASPRVKEVLADVDPAGIMIELTEHVRVDDYPQLAENLWTLRERGVYLAIDDTGAGFSSLMHILKLAPDFIKLDRALTTGIDVDPVLRALAGSLVRFAEETDAVLIAEGVENGAELSVLRDLGIRYAQGFHLARPQPMKALPAAARRGAGRVLRQRRPVAVVATPRSSAGARAAQALP